MFSSSNLDLIGPDAMDQYFTSPFNPPSASDEDFSREYLEAHDMIRQSIEAMGGVCDPVDGHFAMNDTHGSSRWISVELINGHLVQERLVLFIMEALRRLPKDYAVYISHECPEDPIFHLIIFKDRAVCSKSESAWLKLLTGIKSSESYTEP